MPGDGPYIVFEATLSSGLFGNVRAMCNGCETAVRVSNTLALVISGRTPRQVAQLEERDVEVLVPGIPEGKGFYRKKAIEALADLCADIERKQVE